MGQDISTFFREDLSYPALSSAIYLFFVSKPINLFACHWSQRTKRTIESLYILPEFKAVTSDNKCINRRYFS